MAFIVFCAVQNRHPCIDDQEYLRVQYREAGMSEDAIQAMYEFDLGVLNSERAYITNTMTVSGVADDGAAKETSDFKQYEKAVTVTDTYHETKSRFAWIGSPKSKDSIRDIPVPLNVRPCAIKLRDTTDQFIWESPKTGLPCNPTHFRDVFRKSLEEAGDVRLLTPHSCRHTYVSQMQALGVDIQTIQSIVGHADTEMTEHYLHVQESIRQSAIQLFSEAFSA